MINVANLILILLILLIVHDVHDVDARGVGPGRGVRRVRGAGVFALCGADPRRAIPSCPPPSRVSLIRLRLIPGTEVYLGLWFHNIRGLCASCSNMLAWVQNVSRGYVSVVLADSQGSLIQPREGSDCGWGSSRGMRPSPRMWSASTPTHG